jgi:hypothetical protein
MRDTADKLFRWFMIGFVMLLFLMLGISHGKELGDLKAAEEYDRGFTDGWKEALYTRPVSNELEMVCLGLWLGTLAEQKQ